MSPITSRENPLYKQLKKLAIDASQARRSGLCWLEGDHLCSAALARGVRPQRLVVASSAWSEPQVQAWVPSCEQVICLADPLFAALSDLPSPAGVAMVVNLPQTPSVQPQAATVVLDRLQDAGNVGTVLRLASAFGFEQVLALKGTAALWSPKVLRAGMGAHWALNLVEALELPDLAALAVPLWATDVHDGEWLHQLQAQGAMAWPCAWVLGHEGQGVQSALMALAQRRVRIAQPGGEESLNVAAAAAICLHASAVSALG